MEVNQQAKNTQNCTIKNHTSSQNISSSSKEVTEKAFSFHTQIPEKGERKLEELKDSDPQNEEQSLIEVKIKLRYRVRKDGKGQNQNQGDNDEVNPEDEKIVLSNKNSNVQQQNENYTLNGIVSHKTQPTQIEQATPTHSYSLLSPLPPNSQQITGDFNIQLDNDVDFKEKKVDAKYESLLNNNFNSYRNINNMNPNNSSYNNVNNTVSLLIFNKGSSTNVVPNTPPISPIQQIQQPNSSLLPLSMYANSPSISPLSSQLNPNKQVNDPHSSSLINKNNSSAQLNPILHAGGAMPSSLLLAEKSNNSNMIDDDKMIMEIIYSGMMTDLKHFKMQDKQLNYLREFDHLSSIDNKVSPLIIAVYCGNIDHVRQLFSYSKNNTYLDVNFSSKNNNISPLMVACMRGQFEICQFLVAKGADITQTNSDGLTPLYFCFTRLEEEKNYFENKNLCMKMALFLLASGSNINQIINQDYQNTLLMQFCCIQEDLNNDREKDINLSMIKFLVCNGANVFMKNSHGHDCYELAQKHPYKEEVLYIFESFENTIFAQSKTISDYPADAKSLYYLNQNLSLRNKFKPHKRSNQHILTSQSSNQQLLNLSINNSANQNSSQPLNNSMNNNSLSAQNNFNISTSVPHSISNTIHATQVNYNPYNYSSQSNSPINSSNPQIKQTKSLSKHHFPDVQIEGEEEEDKKKPCCSFFSNRN